MPNGHHFQTFAWDSRRLPDAMLVLCKNGAGHGREQELAMTSDGHGSKLFLLFIGQVAREEQILTCIGASAIVRRRTMR